MFGFLSFQIIKTANDEYITTRNNMMLHFSTTTFTSTNVLKYSKYFKFFFLSPKILNMIDSEFFHA